MKIKTITTLTEIINSEDFERKSISFRDETPFFIIVHFFVESKCIILQSNDLGIRVEFNTLIQSAEKIIEVIESTMKLLGDENEN